MEDETKKLRNETDPEPQVPGLNLPNARIETVQENIETNSLTPDQLRNYCEKRFLFKTIKVTSLLFVNKCHQSSKLLFI